MQKETIKKVCRYLVIAAIGGAVSWGSLFSIASAQEDPLLSSQSLSHYIMGTVYEQDGLTEEAVGEFEKAKEFDKSNPYIYFKLGSGYARLGLLKEAIDALKRVVRLRPDELQAHYLLALVYSTQKEYNKAAQEYEIILKSLSKDEPDNIEIYGYLGQLYYSQEKFEEAIEQFQQILGLTSL